MWTTKHCAASQAIPQMPALLSNLKALIIILQLRLRPIGCCLPPATYSGSPYYPAAAYSADSVAHGAATRFNEVNDDEYAMQQSSSSSSIESGNPLVTTASELNCRKFDNNCRWSNTNEDELDWSILMVTPSADKWINQLRTATTLPDPSSAVLIANGASAWDAGQLISDQLPCIRTPLRLTATVWRSQSAARHQQPNLQICTRNTHSLPANLNCNLFPVQNGLPVTVSVPSPRDPTQSAQIVLLGDNFIGPDGGALFVQDVLVGGQVAHDCSVPEMLDDSRNRLEPTTNEDVVGPVHSAQLPSSSERRSIIARADNPHWPQHAQPVIADPITAICSKLACNPAASQCEWLNGIGDGIGWIKSSTKRSTNPLTGVASSPPGQIAFLVAPLSGQNSSVHLLVSPMISVPASAQPLYFCFYEYFATDQAFLSICTDPQASQCIYTRNEVASDRYDSRRWNLRCAQLVSGTYQRILQMINHKQINVRAQNNGINRGDIGFVPTAVTRDAFGNDPVC